MPTPEQIETSIVKKYKKNILLMFTFSVLASLLALVTPKIQAYVIDELRDEGKLYCGCADGGDFEVKIGDAEVTVRCRKCGRLAHIPADSVSAAHAFLEIDSLTLS